MKRSLIAFGLMGIVSAGFVWLDDLGLGVGPGDVVEERVNPNLIRVRINGRWEEFPLIPLAGQSCNDRGLFDRDCDD